MSKNGCFVSHLHLSNPWYFSSKWGLPMSMFVELSSKVQIMCISNSLNISKSTAAVSVLALFLQDTGLFFLSQQKIVAGLSAARKLIILKASSKALSLQLCKYGPLNWSALGQRTIRKSSFNAFTMSFSSLEIRKWSWQGVNLAKSSGVSLNFNLFSCACLRHILLF